MTPDLDGAANLDTKELLAVLLSISLRDVERLIRNSTQELKVDVFVELSEGEALLTRLALFRRVPFFANPGAPYLGLNW